MILRIFKCQRKAIIVMILMKFWISLKKMMAHIGSSIALPICFMSKNAIGTYDSETGILSFSGKDDRGNDIKAEIENKGDHLEVTVTQSNYEDIIGTKQEFFSSRWVRTNRRQKLWKNLITINKPIALYLQWSQVEGCWSVWNILIKGQSSNLPWSRPSER